MFFSSNLINETFILKTEGKQIVCFLTYCIVSKCQSNYSCVPFIQSTFLKIYNF